MTTDNELQRRIQRLEDLQAINNLRYRYWFAILDKNVDALLDCFCDDTALSYGFGIELKGKADIRPFFTKLLGDQNLVVQIARGSNGLLELDSDTDGHGRWLVQVITLRRSETAGRRINVQYFETYKKIDGEWKLYAMKNDYLSYENIEQSDKP